MVWPERELEIDNMTLSYVSSLQCFCAQGTGRGVTEKKLLYGENSLLLTLLGFTDQVRAKEL